MFSLLERSRRIALNNFIVFDLETTGLYPTKGDKIVEIGATYFEKGEKKEVFQTLVNPECPIPKEASNVHKITDGDVKDAPLIKEAYLEFVDFCYSKSKNNYVNMVAHNARFDLGFLQALGFKGIYDKNLFLNVFCTYDLAKKWVKDSEDFKLATLSQKFNLNPNGKEAHRVEADCEMCGRLFLQILKIIYKDYVIKRLISEEAKRVEV